MELGDIDFKQFIFAFLYSGVVFLSVLILIGLMMIKSKLSYIQMILNSLYEHKVWCDRSREISDFSIYKEEEPTKTISQSRKPRTEEQKLKASLKAKERWGKIRASKLHETPLD